jgi:CheY-like chemotaxis protein
VARKQILVVEDNEDLRDLFTSSLRRAGFAVIEAADGLAALRILDSIRPDLIVLDLRIPFVSGFEIQRQLAQHTRRIPVVVVTALPPDQTTDLDVNCVMQKPVDPDDLVRTVVRCLGAVACPTPI